MFVISRSEASVSAPLQGVAGEACCGVGFRTRAAPHGRHGGATTAQRWLRQTACGVSGAAASWPRPRPAQRRQSVVTALQEAEAESAALAGQHRAVMTVANWAQGGPPVRRH